MNQKRRRGPAGGMMVAAALAAVVSLMPLGFAQVAPAPSLNPYSDQIQHLQPTEQAARLASHLGLWCIGTKPFFMGVTKTGHAKGYAYWSVTCAGANSYMIQIAPNGQGAAIDCRTLKAQGEGRECYKSF